MPIDQRSFADFCVARAPDAVKYMPSIIMPYTRLTGSNLDFLAGLSQEAFGLLQGSDPRELFFDFNRAQVIELNDFALEAATIVASRRARPIDKIIERMKSLPATLIAISAYYQGRMSTDAGRLVQITNAISAASQEIARLLHERNYHALIDHYPTWASHLYDKERENPEGTTPVPVPVPGIALVIRERMAHLLKTDIESADPSSDMPWFARSYHAKRPPQLTRLENSKRHAIEHLGRSSGIYHAIWQVGTQIENLFPDREPLFLARSAAAPGSAAPKPACAPGEC